MRLVLASRNPNKLRELRAALPGWEVELVDADEEPVEDGATFLDNARIKARHGRSHAPAADWVAGEDSGVEVAALGGRPGVRSARWADDPVARLLAELGGVVDRRARYVCELVVLSPGGEELHVRGTLDGDGPLLAELGDAWKAAHSHRAQAARALAARFTAQR